jgi:hypothetical protein
LLYFKLGEDEGDSGRLAGKSMTKHKRKQSPKKPIGRVKIVEDFLPSPNKLKVKSKPVKNIHRKPE